MPIKADPAFLFQDHGELLYEEFIRGRKDRLGSKRESAPFGLMSAFSSCRQKWTALRVGLQ